MGVQTNPQDECRCSQQSLSQNIINRSAALAVLFLSFDFCSSTTREAYRGTGNALGGAPYTAIPLFGVPKSKGVLWSSRRYACAHISSASFWKQQHCIYHQTRHMRAWKHPTVSHMHAKIGMRACAYISDTQAAKILQIYSYGLQFWQQSSNTAPN